MKKGPNREDMNPIILLFLCGEKLLKDPSLLLVNITNLTKTCDN